MRGNWLPLGREAIKSLSKQVVHTQSMRIEEKHIKRGISGNAPN
jgi:hypothetical protein